MYNRKFDCILVGMNLLLTGKCCNWTKSRLIGRVSGGVQGTTSIAEFTFNTSRKRRSCTR